MMIVKLNEMERLILKSIDRKIFPGCVLLIGSSDGIMYHEAFGDKALKPRIEPAFKDTIYDLASLTKVVATTTAVMILVEEGKLSVYDDVSNFLDEFKVGLKKQIKVFHLLTHTSGLPPYTDAWKTMKGEKLLDHILNVYPTRKVGEEVIYSCLNFVILMRIVEIITNMRFDEFTKRRIFEPLSMEKTSFKPVDVSNVAPTCEREGKILRGEPDDEIAYHLGGISGNAGLFSTAEDLYKFCRIFLRDSELIHDDVKKFFIKRRNFNGRFRALGWAVKEDGGFMGELASDDAFGHTGFTGTFLVIDPRKDLCIIFLSNRTHVERRKTLNDMFVFRRRLHNLVNLIFG